MNEHKQSKFIIDVSAPAKRPNRSTTRFFSYDSHTAEIVIQAEKDGKLIDQTLVDTVEIYFESVNLKYRPIDGLKWNDTMEIGTDGLYSYILSDDFLNYEGLVAFDVYINYKNGDKADSSNRIIFEQRVSAIDRAAGAVELVYIKDMETAKREITEQATEITENFLREWNAFEAGSTAKMQELDQRIDEQTEIFNNADVYNKAEIEDKLEPFALQTDIAEVSAQLAQTQNEATRKRELEDLSPEVLAAIAGGEGTSFDLLSIPQDNSVTTDKTNFAKAVTNIVDNSKITNGYRYAISNNVVTPIADANYNCILIPIKEANWYSITALAYSDNFTFMCDGAMNPLGKISELTEKISNKIFKSPDNARYLAFSARVATDLTKLVVINSNAPIDDYTEAEYPYNVGKRIEISELYLNGIGYAKDAVQQLQAEILKAHYDSVTNSKASLANNSGWIVFSRGTISYIDAVARWTGNTQYSGVRTPSFLSNSDSVRVEASGTFDTLTSVDVMLRYTETGGAIKYESMGTANASPFTFDFTFDAANYAVYKNATDFGVLIRNTTPTGTSGYFEIQNIKVTEQDIELLDIYDPKLDKTILNIGNKIAQLEFDTATTSDSLFIANGLGDKYMVQVGLTGQVISTPTVPRKTLFMGNSILLSMKNPGGENFGMCASSSHDDYYWHVTQAILAKNPNAMFSKLHVGNLEQGTVLSDYETYITANDAYFTNDLDLVVLQIGDNVNTQERSDYFRQIFPMFLEYLRTKAPNCRVIVVGTWFGVSYSLATLTEFAPKFGCDLVTINDLRKVENQGYSGQIVTYDDGTTGVVSDNWITHPGDLGMQRIADRIITQMNM